MWKRSGNQTKGEEEVLSKHDINNMGDFLSCKNKFCMWGATWSMGHICNYCHLQPCICPCPLTESWLQEHKFEIGLKRVHSLLQHDKGTIETTRRMSWKESNKQKWHKDGILEEIRRMYDYVPQLKEMQVDKK